MSILNDFSEEIMQEAEQLLTDKQRKVDLTWELKLKAFDNMIIFHKCSYIIGMPKKEFLKRLVNIRPFIRQGKNNEPFESMLSSSFNKLNDMSFGTENSESRVLELHRILNILAVEKFRQNALTWLTDNGELVGHGLLKCLNDQNMYLVTEACYVSSYIVYFLASKIQMVTSQALIKGCIDIISMRVMDLEVYVENYRAERIKHDDLELFAGKELAFHWPKFQFRGVSTEFSAKSCAIYTLAFIFQFNLFPSILSFFQNQIYCRREIVRFLLFNLYVIVIQNVNKSLFETDVEWKKLPGKLYTDITKALIEKNPFTKKLINEIIHYLQELSSIKLSPLTLNLEHFRVNTTESKAIQEKQGVKSSLRLLLKTSTNKTEKETDNPIELFTSEDDSDDQFKQSDIYQRKSLFQNEYNQYERTKDNDIKSVSRSQLSSNVSFNN